MATHTERGALGIWAVVALLSGLSTIVRCGGQSPSDALLALAYAALTLLAGARIFDAAR